MMYCVLEGPKGAGKSTTLDRLRAALKAHGVAFRELNPTRPGHRLHPWELLARIPRLARVDALRERLYAHRSNHHAGRLGRAADAARDVPLLLGDRSILTSLATRWARTREIGVEAYVRSVRRREHRIPLPDHVFYLDLPIEDLLARLAARRPHRTYGLDHETRAQLENDRQAYAHLAERPPPGFEAIRWHRIDARRAPDAVAADVLSHILTLLEKHHADALQA